MFSPYTHGRAAHVISFYLHELSVLILSCSKLLSPPGILQCADVQGPWLCLAHHCQQTSSNATLTLLGESETLWQGWRESYGCREGEVAFQNLLQGKFRAPKTYVGSPARQLPLSVVSLQAAPRRPCEFPYSIVTKIISTPDFWRLVISFLPIVAYLLFSSLPFDSFWHSLKYSLCFSVPSNLHCSLKLQT